MEPPGPDEMTGERVVLRRITADDAVALNDLVISNLDHLIPFMPWAATDEKTLEFRQGLIERWEAEGESPFGIRVDGRMVGVIGTHRRIGPGGIEIGYWIDQHEEGKGMKYVFKIAPADPKNSFDFEDVADK